MLDNNIDWCDIDSDEEYCIPHLPPLPLVELKCFSRASTGKEQLETVCSSGTVSEISEPSCSSAGGSRRNFADEVCGHKAPDRVRSLIDRVESNLKIKKASRYGCAVGTFPKPTVLKNKKTPGWVCFIGKFPKLTTIDDMISFLKSNEIIFTEIRMGKKRKPSNNTFGYADLPTKNDYDKLLALDGSLYKGRRIRIDHANPKEPIVYQTGFHANRKTWMTRKRKQTVGLGSTIRIYQPEDRMKLKNIKLNPNVVMKSQIPPKLCPEMRRAGCNKVTARSQRWKTIMHNQKRGLRYKHMFVNTYRVPGAFVNSGSRSVRPESSKEVGNHRKANSII